MLLLLSFVHVAAAAEVLLLLHVAVIPEALLVHVSGVTGVLLLLHVTGAAICCNVIAIGIILIYWYSILTLIFIFVIYLSGVFFV